MNNKTNKLINELEKKVVSKKGKSGAFLDKTNYLVEKYRTALFFIFLQLFVILFLIFGYLSVKSDTVVEVMLPKVIKDTDYGKLKIGINSSNKLYYQIFGSYLVKMLFSSDSSNIDKNILTFKRLIYPENIGKYSKNIEDFKNFVVTNSATLSYLPLEESTKINKKGIAVFSSKGVLGTKIGNYPKKKSICTTKIKMFTKNYMLFVSALDKTCTDINSSTAK